jgi:hypothetical protein
MSSQRPPPGRNGALTPWSLRVFGSGQDLGIMLGRYLRDKNVDNIQGGVIANFLIAIMIAII